MLFRQIITVVQARKMMEKEMKTGYTVFLILNN